VNKETGDKTVVILAAGKATRWRGLPKQLMPAGDESIIVRIQRQVFQRGELPTVVTHRDDIAMESKSCLFPKNNDTACDTLLSTRDLWHDQVVVLLGDVIYTKDTMDLIFSGDRPLRVYGNAWEIYGMSFSASVGDDIATHLKIASEYNSPGPRGKLRYFYQSCLGFEMGSGRYELEVLQWVQDKTRDVDSMWEYNKFIHEIVKSGKLDDLP